MIQSSISFYEEDKDDIQQIPVELKTNGFLHAELSGKLLNDVPQAYIVLFIVV